MPELFDNTFKLHSAGGNVAIFHLYRYTTGEYPRYAQYVNDEGKWYIVRDSESGSARTSEYYLPADYDAIDTDWTAKADKTYDRFDEVF